MKTGSSPDKHNSKKKRFITIEKEKTRRDDLFHNNE